MKVNQCSKAVKYETYSYDGMLEQEGIYRTEASSSNARFIVVKHRDISCVLIYVGEHLEACRKESWEKDRFVKLNATLCLEVRETL